MGSENKPSGLLASTNVSAESGRHSGRGGRRPPWATRDLTSGSVPKNLWFIAWPQTVSGSLMMLDRLWDIFLAGLISFQAIAAMGVAQTWTMLAFTIRMGIDTSMRAMVSRAVGAGDLALANHAAMQGFTLSGMFLLVSTILGVLLTESLLRILGISEDLIVLASDFMRLQFVAQAAQGFMMMSGAALQAAGDPITPMRAQVASRIVHFPLSPLFIFGWGWFPEMGIAGAAMAGILAGLVGVVWNFQALFRGVSRLHLKLSEYRLDLPFLGRMVRIATPASVTSMERSLSQLAVIWLVAYFGNVSLAAYALAQRMQMLTNLGSMGMGMGAGVMVGQNLGAGKPERAKKAVGWALLFVLVISISLTTVLWAFSEQFLTIFVRDPAIMEVAISWLRIVVLGFMVMGAGMVFMQSYNTAGDTFIPMVVSLVTIWGVQLPLAIVLSGVGNDWAILGFSVTLPVIGTLGQYGIAWAIVIAMTSRLFLYVPYFFTNRWLRKQVF